MKTVRFFLILVCSLSSYAFAGFGFIELSNEAGGAGIAWELAPACDTLENGIAELEDPIDIEKFELDQVLIPQDELINPDKESLKALLASNEAGGSGIVMLHKLMATNNLGFKPIQAASIDFNGGLVRFVDADENNVIFEAFGNNKTNTYIMPIKALETYLPDKVEALETSSFDGAWVEIKGS